MLRYSHLKLAEMCRSAYDWSPWTVGSKDELTQMENGPTTYYFLRSGHTLYLVFRGTDDIGDWIHNLRFGTWGTHGIHHGWLSLFNEISTDILDFIQDHRDECDRIEIGGHSLGGVLALLALRTLSRFEIKVDEFAVFGTPSPFNRSRADLESKDIWTQQVVRYVNGNDIVPRILNWKNNHVGEEIQLGKRRWWRFPFCIADHNMDKYIDHLYEELV